MQKTIGQLSAPLMQRVKGDIALQSITIDFCAYTANIAHKEVAPMPRKTRQPVDCRTLELDGVRYVVLRESVFASLCRQAGVPWEGDAAEYGTMRTDAALDGPSLAAKLARRRVACLLSQAELARRAGIRPETLNRIERGRTTPDYATIRQLVVAMNAAEREQAAHSFSKPSRRESDDGQSIRTKNRFS